MRIGYARVSTDIAARRLFGLAVDPAVTIRINVVQSRCNRSVRVHVDGFWMDKTVVTNEEFARFAEATAWAWACASAPPLWGRLWAAPNAGHGATFWCALPAETSSAS
jgi:hypothetical protein